MKTEPLFDAIKAGEVKTTKAGFDATLGGVFWGGWSVKDAIGAGYVEYSPEQRLKEEQKRTEFNELLTKEPADGDYSD